ncbi:MAG: helix-turn-helix domain-containing protein [Sphingobium sp.]|nr:helix-turn-helix domain-containing protein [Sphingobium sp.]
MESARPVQLLQHDDSIDRWRMMRARPAAHLRGMVSEYCDYNERTASFAVRAELASTQAVMIFCLGDPLALTGADGNAIRLKPGQAFVAGFADGTSLSRGAGAQAGVHVAMDWSVMARLIDAPLAEIANRVVPLDLFGRHWRDLGDKLGEASAGEARFGLLDAWLELSLRNGRVVDRAIAWAVGRLRADPDIRVDSIAHDLGCSRRHFIARFRDETGMTPGRFARLARFERFWTGLAADPDARLADLAQDAGYYDEAHLSRSVRDMAGMTPGALRAALIPGNGGFSAA